MEVNVGSNFAKEKQTFAINIIQVKLWTSEVGRSFVSDFTKTRF